MPTGVALTPAASGPVGPPLPLLLQMPGRSGLGRWLSVARAKLVPGLGQSADDKDCQQRENEARDDFVHAAEPEEVLIPARSNPDNDGGGPNDQPGHRAGTRRS